MAIYDVTIPIAARTGNELSASQLSGPDPRCQAYGLEVEDLQATFSAIEDQLTPCAPTAVKERLRIGKKLAVRTWFEYDFSVVSLFWTLSSIEMALKDRFGQHYNNSYVLERRQGRRGGGQLISEQFTGAFSELERKLRRRWRIIGLSDFNGSFRGLLNWARQTGILPVDTPVVLQELQHSFQHSFFREFLDIASEHGWSISAKPTVTEMEQYWPSYPHNSVDVLVQEIPKLRNELAHPESFNWTLSPRSAIDGFAQAVQVFNRLWPLPDQGAAQ